MGGGYASHLSKWANIHSRRRNRIFPPIDLFKIYSPERLHRVGAGFQSAGPRRKNL
jgi:hypothetical protein